MSYNNINYYFSGKLNCANGNTQTQPKILQFKKRTIRKILLIKLFWLILSHKLVLYYLIFANLVK